MRTLPESLSSEMKRNVSFINAFWYQCPTWLLMFSGYTILKVIGNIYCKSMLHDFSELNVSLNIKI